MAAAAIEVRLATAADLPEILRMLADDKARRRQCSRLQLTSNKSRKDAHRFYERLGFRPTHLGMKLEL